MDNFGLNLSFEDFDNVLTKEDLIRTPMGIQEFVTDPYCLNSDGTMKGLSELQLETVKHMTQIFKLKTLQSYMGEKGGQEYYEKYTVNEVIAKVGKGGGKDFCSRVAFCYIVYLIHCLRDPIDYYDKSYGVTIDLINLAVNSKQANSVFFQPLTKMLLASPYFQKEAMFYPRRDSIEFADRPIRLFSGHSESESWEGLEPLIFVLDEIAAFKVESELKGERNANSAKGLYDMASASIASRFAEFGKVILLSFPRYKKDFIMTKYKEWEQNKIPGVWGIKAASYEFNPKINEESLATFKQRDPIGYRAKIECEPPEMESAFFREPDMVRRCFSYGINPESEDGTFSESFNGLDGFGRFIHVDLGLVKDRASLCMVHCSGMKEIQVGSGFEILPIIDVDLIHTWEAEDGKEIDFSEIRSMIQYLSRKFSIELVTIDPWNGADTLRILKNWGINSEFHTVKRIDYDTLGTCFYDQRIRGYWREDLVEDELLELVLVNGNKVDHKTTCLVGETRIPLLDGTTEEIQNLVGQKIWTYSFDTKKDRVVPGQGLGMLTGYRSDFVDVVLDSGATVRCTPEHQWLLKDGTYKEAQALRPGIDRIQKCSRLWPVNGGYEMVSDGKNGHILTHRMVMNELEREVIDGEIIHHRDENKTNNLPENLEILTYEQHTEHHSIKKHKEDKEWRKKLSEGTIAFNKLESTRAKRSAYQKTIPKEIRQQWVRKRTSKNPNARGFFRADITPEKMIKATQEEYFENISTAYGMSKILNCGRNVIIRVTNDMGFQNYQEFLNEYNSNHKVREIVRVDLKDPIPVYCLEVEKYHNFALASEVIVHNSRKDASDSLAGAVLNCIKFFIEDQELEIEIWGGEEMPENAEAFVPAEAEDSWLTMV